MKFLFGYDGKRSLELKDQRYDLKRAMEDAEAPSRSAGRVRKKSQKLLEMEDFASAWKEQQSSSKPSSSPKKKTGHGTGSHKSAGGGGVSSATIEAALPLVHKEEPRPNQPEHNQRSSPKRDKGARSDDDPDWKSDDGNIDGTPANPKIIIKSHPVSAHGDRGPAMASTTAPKSMVVTQPLVEAKVDAVRNDETKSKLPKIPSAAAERIKTGVKRSAERGVIFGDEETPKKLSKPAVNGGGGAVIKSILKPQDGGQTPRPTVTTPIRPIPPTPPIVKNKQNNFEEELLKADLAMRQKQKTVKKAKVESVSTAEKAASSTAKTEILPTIIPSASPVDAQDTSAWSSGDERSRSSSGGGAKHGAEEVGQKLKDKSGKKEKRKKEKRDREGGSHSHREDLKKSTKSDKDAAKAKEGRRPSTAEANDTRDPATRPVEGEATDDDQEGYLLFCKTARREVKKDFPSISFSDITRVAVERWNGLSAKEKTSWSKKAAKYAALKTPPAKASSSSASSSFVDSPTMKSGTKDPREKVVSKRSKLLSSPPFSSEKRPPKQRKHSGADVSREKAADESQNSGPELKPNLVSRPSFLPSSSSSLAAYPSHLPPIPRLPPSPPPPSPPKLDPTQFTPPSDVDYSSLVPLEVASSSCTSYPTTSLDSAANLKLLGESLTVIGTRLTATTTPLAVQGGLSVLMDSLLCATAPLTALLTSQVPELKDDEKMRTMQAQIMENAAYIMPGM